MKISQRGLPIALLLAVSVGCQKKTEPPPDHPRLTSTVRMQDVTFHSASLERDMPYRVILPVSIAANRKLPVVYLLHGGGGGYRDWSNYSDVARFADSGLILVMPEGNSSYYVNSAERPTDRYEDYITSDLIADVERKFPTASGRRIEPLSAFPWGLWGDNAGATTTLLSLPEGRIRQERPIWFFHAGSRRACSLQTRNLPSCCRSAISSMNFTQVLVVTIGTSGTVACQNCRGVWRHI